MHQHSGKKYISKTSFDAPMLFQLQCDMRIHYINELTDSEKKMLHNI